MSRKNINFGDKKKKKVTKIDAISVNKILVSKEGPYGTKNTLLDTMIMMFLDSYS